jgi:hypothetical protein
MRSPLLEEWFPDLRDWGYEVTSENTFDYNCIAWAARDNTRIWWPSDEGSGYWPPGAPREVTIEAFVAAYGLLGFVMCDDDMYEQEYERIAIFANESGEPTHAALQVDAERWTSKMGPYHDIVHPLKAIEGSRYGRVVRYMKRVHTREEGDVCAQATELGSPSHAAGSSTA